MSVASSRSSRRPSRDITADLPHWSEVSTPRRSERPSPAVAAGLADLVHWAADIARKLTYRTAPEDHDAIERVRRFALAWLAGQECPEVAMHDLLTTIATIMAAIDRDLLADDSLMSYDAESPRAVGIVWIA